jgi:gamma-glutamyltranspeptidase/glutathione hydrolase
MSSNPAIAIHKGETLMPFGSPGSEVIAQAMVQAFLNVAVFGMDPQQAAEAPRFASYSWPISPVPHDYQPGVLRIEEPIGTEAADRLSDLGHKVTMWPEREVAAGSVCMIQADLRTGFKVGGADPRRTAYAVGW